MKNLREKIDAWDNKHKMYISADIKQELSTEIENLVKPLVDWLEDTCKVLSILESPSSAEKLVLNALSKSIKEALKELTDNEEDR